MVQAIEYEFFFKLQRVGYLCPSALLPGSSCNVGERSTEVDCFICCNRGAISGGFQCWMDRRLGCLLLNIWAENVFQRLYGRKLFVPHKL